MQIVVCLQCIFRKNRNDDLNLVHTPHIHYSGSFSIFSCCILCNIVVQLPNLVFSCLFSLLFQDSLLLLESNSDLIAKGLENIV